VCITAHRVPILIIPGLAKTTAIPPDEATINFKNLNS